MSKIIFDSGISLDGFFSTLEEAYRMVKRNNGAPGIDGMAFDDIEQKYISPFCTNYARKFPCDFLRYSSDLIYELDLDKWTSFISFDLSDKKNYEEFIRSLDKEIKRDCSSMTTKWSEIKTKIKDSLPG